MRTVNGLPVYEGTDQCALDDYSLALANALKTLVLDVIKGNTSDISDIEELITGINRVIDNHREAIADLLEGSGAEVDFTIDSNTYVLTLDLKNKEGITVSSANVDLPLEATVIGGSYDKTNKKLTLVLQSGQNIEIPLGDLIRGLQSEITEQNKLPSDLIDDENNDHKFVTQEEKEQIETNKEDIATLQNNTLQILEEEEVETYD